MALSKKKVTKHVEKSVGNVEKKIEPKAEPKFEPHPVKEAALALAVELRSAKQDMSILHHKKLIKAVESVVALSKKMLKDIEVK